MTKKPKDQALAELAYNAYWQEQPPVWFDDLNQIAQMRWVRVIRAIKGSPRGRDPVTAMLNLTNTSGDEEFLASLPMKPSGKRIDYSKLSVADANRAKKLAKKRSNELYERKRNT